MLQTVPNQMSTQARVISTLTRLRQEWQEATGKTSLLETDGNMGLCSRQSDQWSWIGSR